MKGTRTTCGQCDHRADLIYQERGPICNGCFAAHLRSLIEDERDVSASERLWLDRYEGKLPPPKRAPLTPTRYLCGCGGRIVELPGSLYSDLRWRTCAACGSDHGVAPLGEDRGFALPPAKTEPQP